MFCRTSGLITPPYSNQMQHYLPSASSDTAIADLCAQTVCFLWFESLPTLHEAASQSFPHPRLPDADSLARLEFVRWTREVLSTTQVSTNVVILAMLYIYRLKLANPTVKGKAGSEYRLLTVALMLGNKFLDDNTYTNKTWAEVTSISVKEIHLMEVEFLSNVRYQLMVTMDEWKQWLQKINMFVTYHQRQAISRLPTAPNLPSPPVSLDYSNGMRPESRGRKRSIGDYTTELHNMLPPHKRMSSQPTTPRKNGLTLRSRAGEFYSHDTSPVRRNIQPVPRVVPSQRNFKLPPTLSTSTSGPHSHCSLSPSHLQVAALPSVTTSPTNSSISHFSNHSHGAGYGYSPTSLALQHRTSPYAPVQPVQRLVHRYQPEFPSKMEQHLWYSQLAAGNAHLYRGKVQRS